MSAISPFQRVAQLPALGGYFIAGKKQGSPHSGAVSGLRGAARSLAIGALARGRHKPGRCSVVLAIVDGPETALDMLGDLRAFRAAEESQAAHGMLHHANDDSASPSRSQQPPLADKAAGPQPVPVPHSKKNAGSQKKPNASANKVQPKPAPPAKPVKLPPEEEWADIPHPGETRLPEDLKHGIPLEATCFPAWDVLPTESDRPEGLTLSARQQVVERLREIRSHATNPKPGEQPHALPESYVIFTPVVSLMQPVEGPEDRGENILLTPNAVQDPIALARKLAETGYERTGQVEVRGEFSLRGGILDIFPYTAHQPYRVDFFGDTIESIKPFDPITQRSSDPVPLLMLADSSPERLKRLFMPGASAGPYSILNHLPPDALIIWAGPELLTQRAELYTASLISGRSTAFAYSLLREQSAAKFETLDLHAPPGEELDKKAAQAALDMVEPPEVFDEPDESVEAEVARESDAPTEIHCTALQRLQGEVAKHAGAWKKLAATRLAIYLFCETRGDRVRLERLLTEAEVLPAPSIQLVIGRLSGGFDLRPAGLAAISDREILGRHKHAWKDASNSDAESSKKKKAGNTGRPISSLLELQTGDYVIHVAHGLARYLGLARLEKSGRMEDYLTLQFADQVKLYVPASQISLVTKYIGAAGELELAKLGGKIWQRKKERAKAALRDIAEDLLKVQAARKSRPGICFGPDTEWQGAFEQAFPFDETPDQLSAIAGIKKDMEDVHPMDRLLCGDVGFGKTEVAMRAAFKAVSAGKQVAVLTPTTLLCEQHGRTFKERFAGYPISVGTLSRFKSKADQKKLLQRLEAGRLDVVIGTHRVIQKDIRFKDLGLAIIDEEQRFGVEHKEFFKYLRKSVDVLTLTATPIPRTLHMALLGLRDISNLATPPRNRLPILTKTARVSDDLLRRAILREISRGGQVFMVHPRVKDIMDVAQRLKKLIPEARIAIGHGQMDPDDLEEVMSSFLRGDCDVLVSTTIVESGLDIPAANTILIHEADHFGLAELHQLRGRVGRSGLQAYCYLLLPENKMLTPVGMRRLRALEEFDELGAGFQLALKDLEIRGAGNVLGVQQSGEITEIGYDLYCKLLEATVKELRGEPPAPEELDVTIQLQGAAYLPEIYIEDEKAVLEFYRRLAGAKDNASIQELATEATERFGPLPPPAERLFAEARLRNLARSAYVPFVGLDRELFRLVIKLHGWDLKMIDRALRGLPEARDPRVLDEQTLTFALTLKAKSSEEALREQAFALLEVLSEFRRKFGGKTSVIPSGKENPKVLQSFS